MISRKKEVKIRKGIKVYGKKKKTQKGMEKVEPPKMLVTFLEASKTVVCT